MFEWYIVHNFYKSVADQLNADVLHQPEIVDLYKVHGVIKFTKCNVGKQDSWKYPRLFAIEDQWCFVLYTNDLLIPIISILNYLKGNNFVFLINHCETICPRGLVIQVIPSFDVHSAVYWQTCMHISTFDWSVCSWSCYCMQVLYVFSSSFGSEFMHDVTHKFATSRPHVSSHIAFLCFICHSVLYLLLL